jgi:hypothetical protein
VTFTPYCPGFLGAQVVQLLLANAIDSWDKLRTVSAPLMATCQT